MVFSSLNFIYLFLPICLGLYFLMRGMKAKNILLLIMSLLFYAWGEPVWVILLIFSAVVDYTNGLIIEKHRNQWQAKAALVASLIINLSMLGVFKYSGFFVENINAVLGTGIPVPTFNLPIGISFYTFQTISYTVDVYRDEVKVQHSFANFLLFVSLFPQLIAGPILRYADIDEQIDNRRTTLQGFSAGITRFMAGLGKKVLLANLAGEITTNLIGSDLAGLSVVGAWTGIFFYAMQIYFDFSGYSDMAIGLGKMFGFTYVENFNFPYISKSITEFWRRWHITLSSFFRDYLYIPLGGNRSHFVRNMFIVWLLTGFWHGASWNFILWGLYYFVFLMLEKLFFHKVLDRLPSIFGHIYSILIMLVGWVFFYFDDMSRLGHMLKLMFGISGQPFILSTDTLLLRNNILLIILLVIACIPVSVLVKKLLAYVAQRGKVANTAVGLVTVVYNVAMLFICTAALVGSSYNPFLYFRF